MLVFHSYSQLSHSFVQVTDTSEEMEEKSQLEEQLRAVMDKYKYKRRQIRELQEDLQTMGRTLDNLSKYQSANQLVWTTLLPDISAM